VIALGEHALDDPEVRALLASCKARDSVVLSQRVFEKLSPVVAPVGVLCVAPIPVQSKMPDDATDAVALDRIQDAGNVGAILRTVAAVGIDHVIVSRGTADPWSPRVLRAAMGAHFTVKVHEVLDLRERLATLSGRILATAGTGEAMLYDLDLKGPTIWVFGNEGSGLAPATIATATTTVRIPISAGVESLNVAAAAAVCLFEQARQRRTSRA
jgi:RNA methyltransferase, TrmH family